MTKRIRLAMLTGSIAGALLWPLLDIATAHATTTPTVDVAMVCTATITTTGDIYLDNCERVIPDPRTQERHP